MSNAVSFTTEKQLMSQQNVIESFWKKGKFGQFSGVENVRLNYAYFSQTTRHKCLMISSGRTESYLKFKELIFDLYQAGFNVFIVDHRGQGLSQRMLNNLDKGYVNNFDDYAQDLHTFIQSIVIPHCRSNQDVTEQLYLLSHSMGGAIAVRYLQKYPNILNAVVLSSPMIAFNKGGLPNWLSSTVINIGNKLNRWFGHTPWYFFGQKNYQREAFDDNHLTHSKVRYELFMNLYQQYPTIQLGGVTFHWLQQAVKNTRLIFKDITKIKTPVLVIQSGADSIVDNHAQNDFCRQLHSIQPQSCPNGKPLVIAGADHELFLERDKYRTPALTATLNWFNQHP